MKCPFCNHMDTQVVETRMGEEGAFIRRRRQCLSCAKRFTTYERPDVSFPTVVKKDGRRTEFSHDKLQASFVLALRKRLNPVALFPGWHGERTSRLCRRMAFIELAVLLVVVISQGA